MNNTKIINSNIKNAFSILKCRLLLFPTLHMYHCEATRPIRKYMNNDVDKRISQLSKNHKKRVKQRWSVRPSPNARETCC